MTNEGILHTEIVSKALHEQYGAAIKMLENVLTSCPAEVWDERTSGPPFWQVAYHAMWYLDWYLGGSKEEHEAFIPNFEGEPFENMDKLAKETLTREQLLNYLFDIKGKADQRIGQITIEALIQPPVFEWHGNSVLSSMLYNLRHVMLHIGALNFRILREGIKLENWVSFSSIL
ncbi:MAG: DinB family protein [Candidatus Hodarchaeota archaeon]